MGFSYRKSVNLGPFRVSLSKSGVGYSIGSRAELTGETNRTRNWPSVTFAADDIITPAAAFVLTTLLPP